MSHGKLANWIDSKSIESNFKLFIISDMCFLHYHNSC